MTLTAPRLSELTYRDLVDETVARIPVHNPEWTNFNDSDPGITLVQLFSFLTESLLYRSNRIPDDNRRKFLSLLGIPLQPGTPARGLVTFANRGEFRSVVLPGNIEVRAGDVPFRTNAGLDALPVEWQVFYRRFAPSDPATEELYRQLYASYGDEGLAANLQLYETVPLTAPSPLTATSGVDLAADTIDSSLWVALLRRPADRNLSVEEIRKELAGRTISLGLLPALTDSTLVFAPGTPAAQRDDPLALLRFEIPLGGSLGANEDRQPRYRRLPAVVDSDPLTEPSVVQLTLPDPLPGLWDDIEPLEDGVGNLPPPLEDTALQERLITWVRIRLALDEQRAGQGDVRMLWVAPNAAKVTQRTRVTAERLPPGTGEPDQTATLAHRPVIHGSVRLEVRPPKTAVREVWTEIDDLLAAGPELDLPDRQLPPGAAASRISAPATVFALDAANGTLRFGDGFHGMRPPFNAELQASYDYSSGRTGNVGVGAITSGPSLPDGLTVRNDVPTWGGADAETVADGEKQIARYLQHRDRLVTAEDFDIITRRTPGVALGRVDVLPAFHPDLSPNEPGDAPGAVTLMVLPKYDPLDPDAPSPDRLFLKAICDYLDPRRLVTTEIYLRGPRYKDIWISVTIRTEPGASIVTVREAVKARLMAFLSPLPQPQPEGGESGGWPLRHPVIRLQLLAEASRVPGVMLIEDVQLAADAPALVPTEQIDLVGLELPRVAGLSTEGIPLDELRRQNVGGIVPPLTPQQTQARVVAVPLIPAECR
jgi:hypothetical protein